MYIIRRGIDRYDLPFKNNKIKFSVFSSITNFHSRSENPESPYSNNKPNQTHKHGPTGRRPLGGGSSHWEEVSSTGRRRFHPLGGGGLLHWEEEVPSTGRRSHPLGGGGLIHWEEEVSSTGTQCNSVGFMAPS